MSSTKINDKNNPSLVNFVKNLPSLKGLKVYRSGEAEAVSPERLTPAARRLLIREKNG